MFFRLFELTPLKILNKSATVNQQYFGLFDVLKKTDTARAETTAIVPEKRASSNSNFEQQLESVDYANLIRIYQEILCELRHFDRLTNHTQLTGRLNALISHLQANRTCAINNSHDLAHLFCVIRFFRFCTDRMAISNGVKPKTLRKFVSYYSTHRTKLSSIFGSLKLVKKFQSNLVKLFASELPCGIVENKIKASHFISLIQSKCNFNFSEDFLKQYLFVDEVSDANLLYDANHRHMLSRILQKIRDIGQTPIKAEPVGQYWNHNSYKPYNCIRASRKLTGIRETLTYHSILAISTERISSSRLTQDNIPLYIIQQLLDNDKVDNIALDIGQSKFSITEYIAAIYCLAAPNCKKLIMSMLNRSRIAMPLGFYNDHDFFVSLFPLSGLSYNYKTADGPIGSLNPLVHPCTRIAFLDSGNTKARISALLANALFHAGNDVHRLGLISAENLTATTFVSFAINDQQTTIFSASDLTMITLSSGCFENGLDNAGDIRPNAAFSIEVSDVVILIRSSLDTAHARNTYDYAKNCNDKKPDTQHTLLIEIIESSDEVDTTTYHFWHKIVHFDGNLLQVRQQIAELIEFHGIVYDLGRIPSSLIDLADQKFENDRIYVDIQNSELGPVMHAARTTLNKIKTSKYDYQLQNRLHRLYLARHADLANVIVKTCIDQNNNYYKSKLDRVRSQQLQYTFEALESSPIYNLVEVLSRFDSSQKLQYVWLLDLFLRYESLALPFQSSGQNSMRVVSIVRELQHVYETAHHFLKLHSSDRTGMRAAAEHLRVFPRVMADLFVNMYPVEVFDSLHASVPEVWLTGILHELKMLLGGSSAFDPRISVVSVVGLQSSGKSTFLNNLFYLNFAVNDGKCTNGSNAVILPVRTQRMLFSLSTDEDTRSKGESDSTSDSEALSDSGFDGMTEDSGSIRTRVRVSPQVKRTYDSKTGQLPQFVIVVDTEGISSPENFNYYLKSRSQSSSVGAKDKKLLLFNIGVSDVCVVNSMKEFGAEMNSILRQMTRSLVKLNLCKLRPIMSYVFQCVDNDLAQVTRLKRSSVDAIQQELRRISKREEHSLASRSAEEGHQIFTVPRLAQFGEYSSEYVSRVQEYKRIVMSNHMLLDTHRVSSLSAFTSKIAHANNLLLYREHVFDAESFRANQIQIRRRNFETKIIADAKQMIIRELRHRRVFAVSDFLEDPANSDRVFDMIRVTDPDYMHFRIELRRKLKDEVDYYKQKYGPGSPIEVLMVRVSAHDLNRLRELISSELNSDDKTLHKYIGNRLFGNDLRRTVSEVLGADSFQFLDQAYSAAIDSGYADISQTVEDFLTSVRPLVCKAIRQIVAQSRHKQCAMEFVDSRQIAQDIWSRQNQKFKRQVEIPFDARLAENPGNANQGPDKQFNLHPDDRLIFDADLGSVSTVNEALPLAKTSLLLSKITTDQLYQRFYKNCFDFNQNEEHIKAQFDRIDLINQNYAEFNLIKSNEITKIQDRILKNFGSEHLKKK